MAKKLEDAGCAAVMPLAAPIGSGLGIRNPYNLRIILETVKVPVIVDAGVGTASDAAVAMELGCHAVLMNTGIAGAKEPVLMAEAMRLGVEAGRKAFLAGPHRQEAARGRVVARAWAHRVTSASGVLLITDGFDDDDAESRRRGVARAGGRGGAAARQAARRRGAVRRGDRSCGRWRHVLVVNDRVDVALAAGADGVHLPARGLPVGDARALVGARLVGVSTHRSRRSHRRRPARGADYVVFGPVWPTGEKRAAVGVDALADVVRACAPMPVFALGGVDADRARAVVAVGARVACIGAVLGRTDAGAAARALAAAIG